MTRILVTGAGGMVGRHVAQAARARGIDLRLADASIPARVAPGEAWVAFDVRDVDACLAQSRGVNAIIHCAGVVGPTRAREDSLRTLAVNVTGTANLLQAAHQVGARLISVSTATLYGHRPDLVPLAETAPTDPLTVYDGTKLMAETYCSAHRRTYDSDVASIRTGFVYGQGSSIGEYFLPRVFAGESVLEKVGADHSCDFTYVVDLAEALVTAATVSTLAHSVYNITGGVLRTRGELAATVRALVPGATLQVGPGTDPLRHLRGPCVLERARKDLGWAPRFSLESGLKDWLERLRETRRPGTRPSRRPNLESTRDDES